MSLKEDFKILIAELNRVNSGRIEWEKENGLSMNTAENGFQQLFTEKASKLIRKITRNIYENRKEGLARIHLDDYQKEVKQLITNFHSENKFSDLLNSDDKSVIREFKHCIENWVNALVRDFTHYFPAWTIGIEKIDKFQIGPVRFIDRGQWIEEVNFSSQAMRRFPNKDGQNEKWKDTLKDALKEEKHPDGIAGEVYSAICDTPSVLKVTIYNQEQQYSKKLGELVCKTALDSTSLCFNGEDWFIKQALHAERLPPWEKYRIIETNGYLWFTGRSKSERNLFLGENTVKDALELIRDVSGAISNVLCALTKPEDHKTPQLANRWATALDWYAEGCREKSDSIAIAKFGTSLDVLSGGGKFGGILDMTCHLLQMDHQSCAIHEPKEITLRQLIKNVYDDGRSRILHGNYFDRLVPLDLERVRAANLVRLVLLQCLIRLEKYEGVDDYRAFVTMPKS